MLPTRGSAAKGRRRCVRNHTTIKKKKKITLFKIQNLFQNVVFVRPEIAVRYSGAFITQDISKRKRTRHTEQKKKTEKENRKICCGYLHINESCPSQAPRLQPFGRAAACRGHSASAAWRTPVTLLSQCWARLAYVWVSGLYDTQRGHSVCFKSHQTFVSKRLIHFSLIITSLL